MIFDSSNVTASPTVNLFWVKYAISTIVAETRSVICAIAPLVDPIIFSPNTDAVLSANPLTNTRRSKTGLIVVRDS